MICPKCGRTIPDGTQCPCSMGQPVLSSNPSLNVIKTIGSSTLFLVLAILLSVTTLLSFFTSLFSDSTLNSVYHMMMDYGIDPGMLYPFLDSASVVGAVFGMIPSFLILAAVWQHYATCKSRASGNISTVGLTICKVITYISLIAVCALGAIFAVAVIIIVAAGVPYTYQYYTFDSYSGGVAAGISVVLVIVLVFLAIFLALYISYEVCVIKTINRIKATAMTGVPDNRIPKFMTVMNYIFAASSVISGIYAFVVSPFSVLGMLMNAAVLVIISICLGNYRKQMTMLLYPPVQPVYAVPPVQAYDPAQYYAQPYGQPPVPQQAPAAPTAPSPEPPVQEPAAPIQPEPAPAEPERPSGTDGEAKTEE